MGIFWLGVLVGALAVWFIPIEWFVAPFGLIFGLLSGFGLVVGLKIHQFMMTCFGVNNQAMCFTIAYVLEITGLVFIGMEIYHLI